MTPSARLGMIEDFLDRLLTNHRIPMDSLMGDYFRARRFIGSKDRADMAERTYTIMRHFARLTWWAEKLDITPDARHLALLYLVLVERLSPSALDSLYDGSRYGASQLDESERALIRDLAGRDLHAPDMPPAVRYECPPEHVERLIRIFTSPLEGEVDELCVSKDHREGGKDVIPPPDQRAKPSDRPPPQGGRLSVLAFPAALQDLMSAMMTSAPLDLRLNTMKATRDQAIGALAHDHVTATPTPYSPVGLRLADKVFLSNTAAFKQGLVDIQDEGSQLIAHICGAAPGMQVLDYCAGAGGKTLALAAAMRNKGRIVAMDTEPARLEKSRLRFRRAGVADIIEVRALTDEKNRKWLRRQKGTFDVTLVDAPCSGSGTWRRNPDGRWRSFGPNLDELVTVQAEILDRVAGTVKPGGRLVYATCSLFLDENEDQVDRFLAAHPEFSVLPVPDIWPAGTPCPVTGPYLRLFPHIHQTDGFFAAVFVRNVPAPQSSLSNA